MSRLGQGNILLFCPSGHCTKSRKRRQTKAFDVSSSAEGHAGRATGVLDKKGQGYSLDIASLNMKSMKTKLTFVKISFTSVFHYFSSGNLAVQIPSKYSS